MYTNSSKTQNRILFGIITFIIVVLMFMPVKAQAVKPAVNPSMSNLPQHTIDVALKACREGVRTRLDYLVRSWNSATAAGENPAVKFEYQVVAGQYVSGYSYVTTGSFSGQYREFSGVTWIDDPMFKGEPVAVEKVTGLATAIENWGDGNPAGTMSDPVSVAVSASCEETTTPTATATATSINTATATTTYTPTAISTIAQTPVETIGTVTATPTATPTQTATATPTNTATATATSQTEYGRLIISVQCNDDKTAVFIVKNAGNTMNVAASWVLTVDGVQKDSDTIKLAAGQAVSFSFEQYKGALSMRIVDGSARVIGADIDPAICDGTTAAPEQIEPISVRMQYSGTETLVENGLPVAFHRYKITCATSIFIVMEAENADGTADTLKGAYCEVDRMLFRKMIAVARLYDQYGNFLGQWRFGSVDVGPQGSKIMLYMPLVAR